MDNISRIERKDKSHARARKAFGRDFADDSFTTSDPPYQLPDEKRDRLEVLVAGESRMTETAKLSLWSSIEDSISERQIAGAVGLYFNPIDPEITKELIPGDAS